MSLPWIATAALVWLATGFGSASYEPMPLTQGSIDAHGTMLTDPVRLGDGYLAVVEADVGKLLIEFDDNRDLLRGAVLSFQGHLSGDPGRWGTHRYIARVDGERLQLIETAPFLFELGQSVRSRVAERVEPMKGGRALLAGFLIGDTSGLDRAELEAMRRAGLSHFVAVSGSNVALFVGILVLAAGPLAMGPRRRAIVGLLGLPVYAAATRFEPSVLRASAMAGLALGGRLVGVVFEAWQLLSLAVAVLLLVDPLLGLSAGFQLSVAATAGVLVGARWPTSGGRVARSLLITVGAQTAVAPLILIHFGSVPLMSPLVNLMAAPLVAASTTLGAVGVVGPELLVDLAAGLATVVLALASGSETWPQLGVVGFSTLVVGLLVAATWRRSRPVLGVVAVGLVSVWVLGFGRQPADASATVLDVGQGDAILLHGGDGLFALVDGGPDEIVLFDRLREYGVDRLELVVLSHVHADHATGLLGLPGRVEVGQVWARARPHTTEASKRLFESFNRFGIPVVEPRVGDRWTLGQLEVTVEGPLRRYESPNDQSIVLIVSGSSDDLLLAGDIEVIAQRELAHLEAEVLKVPHQGAATSDPTWLRQVGARLAIISVGPNQFGHPADWVVDVLSESGARVVRTDEEGDITVTLG